jgi:hypothetical protein
LPLSIQSVALRAARSRQDRKFAMETSPADVVRKPASETKSVKPVRNLPRETVAERRARTDRKLASEAGGPSEILGAGTPSDVENHLDDRIAGDETIGRRLAHPAKLNPQKEKQRLIDELSQIKQE